MPLLRRVKPLLPALLLAGALSPAWAQAESCAPGGSPDDTVKSLIEKARAEIRQFREAGGKPEDAQHPAARWSEILWRCRETHPGTPAAAEASAEAVHILIHAARASRALELADSVPANDPAWKQMLSFLFEAAEESNDFPGCVRRLERLLPNWQDGDLRAHGQMTLAQAYRRLGEDEQAAQLYETVQREAAGTPPAERATAALRQLRELNPGQPAPGFEARARDGSAVTLAGYRDRAVLLIFWSTA